MVRKFNTSVLVALLAVLYCVVAQTQPGLDDDLATSLAEQAAEYQATVQRILEKRALSIPAVNQVAVSAVLGEAQLQLEQCAIELQAHQQIWTYKVCGSAALNEALDNLNVLQATGGARSYL